MSCLIEENVIVRSGDDIPVVVPQGRSTLSLNVASIEQRIRRELEDLGVLQALAQKVTALSLAIDLLHVHRICCYASRCFNPNPFSPSINLIDWFSPCLIAAVSIAPDFGVAVRAFTLYLEFLGGRSGWRGVSRAPEMPVAVTIDLGAKCKNVTDAAWDRPKTTGRAEVRRAPTCDW